MIVCIMCIIATTEQENSAAGTPFKYMYTGVYGPRTITIIFLYALPYPPQPTLPARQVLYIIYFKLFDRIRVFMCKCIYVFRVCLC